MSQRLPNLNQLRAFEAAARRLSFKDAADELHVTHAAVSHQIKALEQDLGLPLFHRITRGVQLTPEAQDFAAELTRSFAEIGAATERLRQSGGHGTLRVTAIPAFSNRFLLPRLGAFHETNPGLEIKLSFDATLVDLSDGDFDAAIRYGLGTWPSVTTRLIQRDLVTPLCAPNFIEGRALPLDPAEIVALPYALSPRTEGDWAAWCAAVGLGEVSRPEPLHFENRAVLLDYLLLGHGLALYDVRFAAQEIASGRLVRMHPTAVEGAQGIYLAWPNAGVPDPRIVTFGDWLAEEAAARDLDQGRP